MVSCALLYNFTGKKAEMTKMVCMMMNIRFKSVGQEDYHQPLGALLGMEDVPLKEAKADKRADGGRNAFAARLWRGQAAKVFNGFAARGRWAH